MKKIEYSYLIECLIYDPDAGSLIWKERPEYHFGVGNTSSKANCEAWNKRYANKAAGSFNKKTGYFIVGINGGNYRFHRICWFIYHGYMPENGIDHKDRDRTHNWISNLRETTQQCNVRNAGMMSNNTSGVKGVGFHKKRGKWCSQITVNQKNIHLGYFKYFIKAVIARWEGEKKYGFPNCCTSSSSYNYLKGKGAIP